MLYRSSIYLESKVKSHGIRSWRGSLIQSQAGPIFITYSGL